RGREVFVGASSAKAIWDNKLAPQIADRYPARSGYDSQVRDETAIASRPDNLFSPLPGDHGAGGVFGDRTRSGRAELCASKHRNWLLAGAAFVGTLATMLSNGRS